MSTETAKAIVRCGCGWPAFRTVTVDLEGKRVRSGPTCRACLDSIQQDGRYFTATIQIGPVIADDQAASEWHGATRPASMSANERDRQSYRIAADVARALAAVPGWQVTRSGVCVNIRFKGHGPVRHGDAPDYYVWIENTTDMHLHKAIEASVRRQDSSEYLASPQEHEGSET